MKLAERIARWLEEREITHGFGIIGGGNVALWGAIAEYGRCHLVSFHHEQAAAMAGAALARCTGRIGFALVTTGAGSTNAITGVMAAHMDGIPLLVISGNEASQYMGGATRIWGTQGYDSSGLAKDFTKWARRVREPETAIEVLDLAAEVALKCPQGPVWVDIPKDLQSALV